MDFSANTEPANVKYENCLDDIFLCLKDASLAGADMSSMTEELLSNGENTFPMESLTTDFDLSNLNLLDASTSLLDWELTWNCSNIDASLNLFEDWNQTRNFEAIVNGNPEMCVKEKNIRRRYLLFENSELCSTRSASSKLEQKRIENQSALLSKTDNKLYHCTVANCRKTYTKPSHLRTHLIRHSGEKPFVCDWAKCTWRFSRSDELARHKRSHSGYKPYKCNFCEKAFARSDHLSKHNRIHLKKMQMSNKC